jgi:hypothetical protein
MERGLKWLRSLWRPTSPAAEPGHEEECEPVAVALAPRQASVANVRSQLLMIDEGCLSAIMSAVYEQHDEPHVTCVRGVEACATVLAEVEATMEEGQSEEDVSWEEGELGEEGDEDEESAGEGEEEESEEELGRGNLRAFITDSKWEERTEDGQGFGGAYRHWMRAGDVSGTLALGDLCALAMTCHGMWERVNQWASTLTHGRGAFIASDTRLEYARRRLPELPAAPTGLSRLAQLDQLIMDSLHAVKLYVYPAWRPQFSNCEVWLHADRNRGFACVSSIGVPCSELGADWSWRLPNYNLSGEGEVAAAVVVACSVVKVMTALAAARK